jgi:hypothetical protein
LVLPETFSIDMKTSWVVQSNIPNSDSPSRLQSACRQVGRPYFPVLVEPGQRDLPDLGEIQAPLVFHGVTTLILRASESDCWNRGVFYDAENFTHQAYCKGFGSAYLNCEGIVMDWPSLLERAANPPQPLFIKPVNDLKAFTGFVAGAHEICELHRKLAAVAGRLTHSVVAAPRQEVDAEWRLFVVDGVIVSGSMYRPTAETYLPEDLLAFAAECIEKWTPSPVFVLDVGRVDSSWRIIECNCFNWSRFYLANVPLIVERISEFQERNWQF